MKLLSFIWVFAGSVCGTLSFFFAKMYFAENNKETLVSKLKLALLMYFLVFTGLSFYLFVSYFFNIKHYQVLIPIFIFLGTYHFVQLFFFLNKKK